MSDEGPWESLVHMELVLHCFWGTGLISEEIGKLEGRVNKEAKTNAPRLDAAG